MPRVTSSLAFNVAGFGAKGDGQTPDTIAFQHAIEAARQAGGAAVAVPRGTYLIGPIDLYSGLKLQLAEGAVIQLTDDPAAYPLVETRYGGMVQQTRRAGILADGCQDISISGSGVIEGSGAAWWARNNSDDVSADLSPEARAASTRPPMLQLRNCRNVRIDGVKFRNPARSAVHVLFSDNVWLRSVEFDAPEGSDTTGVEIDSARMVRLDDCHAAVGRRGIAIEAGRQPQEAQPGRPTEDVAIRAVVFARSTSAIAVGPDVDGGVLRLRVQNCRFEGGSTGVQLQSSPGRTGTIQDVRLTDLQMRNVETPFVLSLRGQSIATESADASVPSIRNVEISRLTVRDALRAGIIEGQEKSPIRNLRFETLNLSANYGISCSHAADVSFNVVQIATDFGPAILRTDTTNLQIDNWIEATRPVEPPPATQPAPATQPGS